MCNIELKHGKDPDENFDPKWLDIGTVVETEHTDDTSISKQIAKAHLSEFPEYYLNLAIMENAMKRGHQIREVF